MNMLLRAARCEDRDFAASLLLTVLHIKGEDEARAILPEPAEWRGLTIPARLEHLASWLTAECFALAESQNLDAESAAEARRHG